MISFVFSDYDYYYLDYLQKLHCFCLVVNPNTLGGKPKVYCGTNLGGKPRLSCINRILTGDNLRFRSFDFVDQCIMCRRCGKTVEHLLLHCGKAYRLWCFVFRIFGISWVPSCTVSDFPFGWWNWLGKHSSYIWNLVPLYLMWCIQRERNRWTFEDLDKSDDQLLSLFSGSIFDWARVWGLTSSDSLPLFLSSLLICNKCFFIFLLFHLFFVLFFFLINKKEVYSRTTS